MTNPDEPTLTEDEYNNLFDSPENEIVPTPKSSIFKTVAVVVVLALISGSAGFLAIKLLQGDGVEQAEPSEAVEAVEPTAFFFTEEQRWFCVEAGQIVECDTPHTLEKYYIHFDDPTGATGEYSIEQIRTQQVQPMDFCLDWFAANISDPKIEASLSEANVVADTVPTGIFCDLTFSEPQNRQVVEVTLPPAE